MDAQQKWRVLNALRGVHESTRLSEIRKVAQEAHMLLGARVAGMTLDQVDVVVDATNDLPANTSVAQLRVRFGN